MSGGLYYSAQGMLDNHSDGKNAMEYSKKVILNAKPQFDVVNNTNINNINNANYDQFGTLKYSPPQQIPNIIKNIKNIQDIQAKQHMPMRNNKKIMKLTSLTF